MLTPGAPPWTSWGMYDGDSNDEDDGDIVGSIVSAFGANALFNVWHTT